MIVWLAIVLLVIAGMWKIFVKAGKPGWAAIIPIYNFVVLCEIAGKPAWWVVLLFVPVVNFIIIAFVLYLFIVKFLGMVMRAKKEEAAAPPPPTRDQELLAEIRDLLKRRPAQP